MILSDEVVIISGVGAGLGAKLAARAAAEGAKVVLAARSGDVTDQVAAQITAAGGDAIAVRCDVRKREDVERVAATAVETFGAITGLVNAAYSHPGLSDLLETSDQQLRRSMDVILHGGLEMSRAVVPHMAGGGSIVNVGTMSTRKPMRGEGGYAVAKAAMGCATQYLALELGEKGIRVNQAVLGWLDGPGVRFFLTMTAEASGISEQEVYDDIASRNPLNRIPADEACAGAVLYLLSSLASEVTGAIIDVNGGEYMPA
ncbi:carbonyl reductase [Aeromicrobium sp. A1-2]|uniref:SDR family oxidoreductase n=1 Tax=Aeromicrobium sp. A1-2 TaxID=2107713 RepID=UPI000E4BDC3F|nr:SDR family oxidoreductase [Aeromicrobium sp. A1-2]AXT86733.1 carbonyl reductase [Aeromicrobium sp. A1-2]